MLQGLDLLRALTNLRVMAPAIAAAAASRYDALTLESGSRKDPWSARLVAKARMLIFVYRWLRRERLIRHRGQWVVNSFLPPFPGRAYERTFQNFVPDRRMTPISAFVALTSQCPSDCTYCSMRGRRCGPDLSREEWLSVIAQLHDLQTCLIAFTGGEPLTRDDLPELVRAAHDGGAEVELFTSGVGLTETKACALQEAGLWAMGISLDRCDRQSVNRVRRHPQAFDAAIAALEMSRRTGFYTFINAVADREAVVTGEYRRLYELARRLQVHELRLIEPMACGRLLFDGHAQLLEPEHVAELRRFHRQINRRGRGPKACAFSEIESPELFGCTAGTLHLFIDPSGEVCPCDFTPLSFGNVLD